MHLYRIEHCSFLNRLEDVMQWEKEASGVVETFLLSELYQAVNCEFIKYIIKCKAVEMFCCSHQCSVKYFTKANNYCLT